MRLPIWQKDDFFQFIGGDRIDMDPSVVIISDQDLPLVYGYNFNSVDAVIGHVADVRLEGEEIIGDVNFFDEKNGFETLLGTDESQQEPLCRLGGYYLKVEKRRVAPDREIVISCELKAVSIMMMQNTPGWGATVRNT